MFDPLKFQAKGIKTCEEMQRFIDEVSKTPKVDFKAKAKSQKSFHKVGINENAEEFDSFSEYTFCTYKRRVEGATVQRNLREHVLFYIDPKDNKQKKYYPDFIVNGVLSEVKGRYTEKDRAKHDQHPEVQWYFQEDINKMAAEMDKNLKGWRENFTETK